MPKAESTDNLLTHKLYTNETDERIFTGLKKTRETDNSPAYLKKILSLSLVAMAVTQTLAEPTGGQVVKGQAQINQTGTQGGTVTTIKQSTPQVSINWQSFNVGEKERVNFVQPDASSLAINRILGSQGSSIQGDINANGQVWLINPNGIVFGKNAQVNVGGLVATTLDAVNPGSLTGTQRFSGNSTAAVTNSGLLSASEGGFVALLGHRVSNQGEINAPAGTVALGAGSTVDLQFNNNQLLGVQVYESLLDAMSENAGVIRADAGQVLLKAGAQGSLLRSAVNNSGIIQARTLRKQGGKIVLVSGMKAGVTTISGTLDASSSDDGNGGFIESSGNKVQITDSSYITTHSAGGKNGNWLIDPDDFVVAARGGNISGAVLSAALNSNDVTIQTTDGQSQVTGVTNSANTQGNGDILVNDAVSWSGNTKLTLNAYRNIVVNAPITASHANGFLAIKYGQGSEDGSFETGISTFRVNAPIGLQEGGNFSVQKGNTGSNNIYRVITALGSQTDNAAGSSAMNSLQSIAKRVNWSNYYALGADIDASATAGWNSGKGFTPIGSFSGTGFSGLFEGLGHQISGLTINNPTKNYMGMFGYSTSQLISNLRLNNLNIKGNIYTGGLVGRYASGGQIFNVSATGNVSGYSSTGGLIGSLDSGSLDLGSFTGNAISRAGGIKLGGIAGALGGGGAINRSFFDGNLNGANTVGGLVGDSQGAINQSYANIAFDVSTANFVGGLVGINAGSINNSYAKGSIKAYSTVGGLVGFNNVGGIQNSYSLVVMYRNSDIDFGSLVGTDYLGTYINTYYDASINPDMAGPGTGLTHAQFFQNSSFQGMDFDNKWFSYDGYTVPLLRAFLKPLEITVMVSGSKTYDGTTACATVVCSYTTSATSPVSESHLWGTAVTTLSSKNAGTVNVGSFSGLYSDQKGYLITTKFIGEAIIDKADLTVTATRVTKTYDGTTTASGSGSVGTIAGANAGESVKTAGSQFYLDKNAGKNKTVRANGVTIKDSDNADVSGNYNIRYEDNTGSQIDKADLTVTATQVSKTYDGTTTASGSGSVGTIAGANAGESVKTAGSQFYLDKNAGNNKTVRASGVAIKDSDNADVSGNYNINYADNTSSAIDKADLTVTATQVSKTYDGTTAASGTGNLGTLAGANAGESVKTAGSQVFLDKSAGSNKTVRASGVAIKDSDNADVSGNYNITYVDNTNSQIDKADLTVTATQVRKTYDGTTAANGSGSLGTLAGAGAGESAKTAGSQFYLDKNAGNGKTVRASGVAIKDSDNADVSSNYNIRYEDNTSSAIDKADLTVTATQVRKTYDGTTAANGTGSVGSLAGAGAGESVKTAGSQVFLDKNAGNNKTVRASGVAIKDSDNADVSSNYNIRYEDNTSSAIDKADLTVTATQVRKTYDGTTAATGTGSVGSLAGANAGESVKTAGSQFYLDKNAGNNKTVRASGVTIKDSDNVDVSANYNITYVDNTGSSINKLMLESFSHPIQQFNQTVAPSFKPVDMLVVNQMGNASASSPTLLLPAGLQKDLAWPSNQTPSNQTPSNQSQNNPLQSNPAQNNPLPDTPSSKKDNDD